MKHNLKVKVEEITDMLTVVTSEKYERVFSSITESETGDMYYVECNWKVGHCPCINKRNALAIAKEVVKNRIIELDLKVITPAP